MPCVGPHSLVPSAPNGFGMSVAIGVGTRPALEVQPKAVRVGMADGPIVLVEDEDVTGRRRSAPGCSIRCRCLPPPANTVYAGVLLLLPLSSVLIMFLCLSYSYLTVST